MVIRSRVKPERRVEGEGHSLAVVAFHGCGCNRFEVQPGTLGEHNGTYKGVQRV